ncbi:hypothetical protein DL768_008757 [Monosporascus sp. mg162]|nr:hypothetical protein DL768_008757 [Monosporascus sp. mg162]
MDSTTGNSPAARPASNTGSELTSASEPPFEPMPDVHQMMGDYTGCRELTLWGPLVVNGLVRVASDLSVGGVVHARRSWALTGSLEIKSGSQLTTESDVATGSLCVCGRFKSGGLVTVALYAVLYNHVAAAEIRVGGDLYLSFDASTVGGDESIDEVSVMGQLIVCKDAKLPLGRVIVFGDVILEDMTFLVVSELIVIGNVLLSSTSQLVTEKEHILGRKTVGGEGVYREAPRALNHIVLARPSSRGDQGV